MMVMKEVVEHSSGSREPAEGLDAKSGWYLVDVQVCRSGIRCSHDVCRQTLAHGCDQVLSRIKDHSMQIVELSDSGFDAWMAREDGCVGVGESMVAFRGLVGSLACCR